ncbi:MAG: GRP family sugar transporter [Acidobacteriaceae bacterium]
MYQPQVYGVALFFMIVSMCCWGSWANTLKLTPGHRFQLFYWDYVIGLFVGALAFGLTLGSMGSSGYSFFADLVQADAHHAGLAFAGGVVFNVANLLLVAAIDIAGLAVAFPVGIGVALVVGAVSNYILSPTGNPLLLFGGIAIVILAIILDAAAYRLREQQRSVTTRGVVISLISGVLMGSFYPFVSRSMTGTHAPGPYAATFWFVVGVAVCSLVFNTLLMRKPLDGSAPVAFRGWAQARASWHLWGVIGGAIWCTGTIMNFVASRAHIVGPAVSYSIGQGATMISASWGVFVWHEFASAPRKAKTLLAWMFVLFVCGLTAVALAPVF